MTVQESEIKITDEFNDCPGGDAIKDYFQKSSLDYAFEFVDIEESLDWYNDPATIVIRPKTTIEANTLNNALLHIGKFATECHVNEFDWKTVNNRMIIRLWWD